MKNKLLLFSLVLISILTVGNVSAAGKIKLSLSCPGAAKPNTEIKCIVYANRTGSEVESVEEVNAVPTGSLKRADYLVDYDSIPTSGQKNIGSITIQTGSIGTGQIELTFYGIHFVDESFQESVTVKKTIKINKTGSLSNNNTQISGSTTNNNTNSNSNTTNNNANSNTNSTTTETKDTYLQGIKVSRGILSPAFSKSVYKYTVKVGGDVSTISIDGIKGNTGQKIEGEITEGKINYGKNTFKLTVSNGNATKRTYTIVVEREDTRDSNALLSSVSLSSGAIQFSPSTFNYETKVLYETQNITVLATPEKSTSVVTVVGANNLKVGANVITITVKAQKGNTQIYTIKINRLNEGETLGDNASIKNITVTGYEFPFDYNKTSYKLVIRDEKTLDISVEMDDPGAFYDITGNTNLKDGSVINIETKSLDGTQSKRYRIEITKPKYTMYYVIGGLLIALAIAIPIVFYVKYVKNGKTLFDINGNRISKDDAKNTIYRKKLKSNVPKKEKKPKGKKNNTLDAPELPVNNGTAPNMTQNPVSITDAINNSVNNTQNANVQQTPQYVVNIKEAPVQEAAPSNTAFAGGKCPKCGRELLGSPSICPYCNTKLR